MRILIALCTLAVLIGCKGNKAPEQKKPENLAALVKLHPDSVPLLVKYGRQLIDEYRSVEALPLGAKAFRLDSSNLEARYLYAIALVNRTERTVGDVQLSQRHFKVIVDKQPGNKEALVGLASTYSLQGDYERSFRYINSALRVDSRYRDAYVMKGSNYLAMGNRKLAKSSYETAIQQDPKFFAAYLQLGWLYTEDQEYQYALEYFRTAAQLEPTSTDALYGVAYCEQELKMIPQAQASYRRLLSTDTSYYLALFNQGYIKQFEEKQIDSAIYFYQSAIDMHPDFVKAWHNLGLCYVTQGRKPMAFKAFKKALEYNEEFELSKKELQKL